MFNEAQMYFCKYMKRRELKQQILHDFTCETYSSLGQKCLDETATALQQVKIPWEDSSSVQSFLMFPLVPWMMDYQVSFALAVDIQVSEPARLFEDNLVFKVTMTEWGTNQEEVKNNEKETIQ